MEIKKIPYDYEDIQKNKNLLKFLKIDVFKELKEDAFFIEFARLKNIRVSKEEFKDYIKDIKSCYPEGAFEAILEEKALNYSAWERKKKRELIIQKVIKKEVVDKIEIKKEEFNNYYNNYVKDNRHESMQRELNERVLNLFKNDKKEQEIKKFLNKIKKTIKIKINEKEWEKIRDEV